MCDKGRRTASFNARLSFQRFERSSLFSTLSTLVTSFNALHPRSDLKQAVLLSKVSLIYKVGRTEEPPRHAASSDLKLLVHAVFSLRPRALVALGAPQVCYKKRP